MRTLQRRRRAAFDRSLPAVLLISSLVLQGCPVTSVVGASGQKKPAQEDPGPPSVLEPSLLDRG
jgi:hypothetical protein